MADRPRIRLGGSFLPPLVILALAYAPLVTTLTTRGGKLQGRRLQIRQGTSPVILKTEDDLTHFGKALKTATAGKDVQALDMILSNLPPAPFVKVSTVRAIGWAAKAGILAGAEIVKINGKAAKEMSQQDFTNAMRARPLTIAFKEVQVPTAAAPAVAPPPPPPKAGTLTKPKTTPFPLGPMAVPDDIKKKGPAAAEAWKRAYKAGSQAGARAGQAIAKQLVDQLKNELKPPVDKLMKDAAKQNETIQKVEESQKKVEEKIAPTIAPKMVPLPPQAVVPGGVAPAPAAGGGVGGPLPPSPMDALKAAMGIRAGIKIGDGPMLSPEVLDYVAKMAHGKLGNMSAFLPPGGFGVPCPGDAPAPAPLQPGMAVKEKLRVSLTLMHVSFTALLASPTLMAETEQAAKQSIAESANVDPSGVDVKLNAGSVKVDGLVDPGAGRNISDVGNDVKQNSQAMGARLVARVSALPGIESVALGNITCTNAIVSVVKEFVPTTTITTTPAPVRHLPKPPACAAAPKKLTKGDVAMAMAPFKPSGAKGKGVKTKDGGTAWPLQDGGWAFQYPDMAVRMQQDGSTRIVWNKPAYAIEYDESGISYHVGRNVVHRDTNGDLTYQQPTGTMHREGETLVYHWCNPNVIIYQTPNGLVYYDDLGMTYRSLGKEVTHYTWSGQVLYQGVGGITKQSPDGTVTHWTDAGAVFRHPDGSISYTPTGERESQPLSVGELGGDPFPGKELTMEEVMTLSKPAPLADAPAPAVPPPPPPSLVPGP